MRVCLLAYLLSVCNSVCLPVYLSVCLLPAEVLRFYNVLPYSQPITG